eukprot:scaffold116106_cov52-Attheya_sp.AAC.1
MATRRRYEARRRHNATTAAANNDETKPRKEKEERPQVTSERLEVEWEESLGELERSTHHFRTAVKKASKEATHQTWWESLQETFGADTVDEIKDEVTRTVTQSLQQVDEEHHVVDHLEEAWETVGQAMDERHVVDHVTRTAADAIYAIRDHASVMRESSHHENEDEESLEWKELQVVAMTAVAGGVDSMASLLEWGTQRHTQRRTKRAHVQRMLNKSRSRHLTREADSSLQRDEMEAAAQANVAPPTPSREREVIFLPGTPHTNTNTNTNTNTHMDSPTNKSSSMASRRLRSKPFLSTLTTPAPLLDDATTARNDKEDDTKNKEESESESTTAAAGDDTIGWNKVNMPNRNLPELVHDPAADYAARRAIARAAARAAAARYAATEPTSIAGHHTIQEMLQGSSHAKVNKDADHTKPTPNADNDNVNDKPSSSSSSQPTNPTNATTTTNTTNTTSLSAYLSKGKEEKRGSKTNLNGDDNDKPSSSSSQPTNPTNATTTNTTSLSAYLSKGKEEKHGSKTNPNDGGILDLRNQLNRASLDEMDQELFYSTRSLLEASPPRPSKDKKSPNDPIVPTSIPSETLEEEEDDEILSDLGLPQRSRLNRDNDVFFSTTSAISTAILDKVEEDEIISDGIVGIQQQRQHPELNHSAPLVSPPTKNDSNQPADAEPTPPTVALSKSLSKLDEFVSATRKHPDESALSDSASMIAVDNKIMDHEEEEEEEGISETRHRLTHASLDKMEKEIFFSSKSFEGS